MQTSEPLVPVSEIEEAIERADRILVDAMKRATVIVTLHDLNEVTAAAARAIERVTELEAQMAEACERLERILAGGEPCEATAEALMREFAEEQPGVADRVDEVEPGEGDAGGELASEREWLSRHGLDVTTALMFVRHRVESPDERQLSVVTEKFDLTDEQAMAMGRRYSEQIVAMRRESRSRVRAKLLREFGDWLGAGEGVAA